jgi:hypothetical protein
MEYEFYSMLDVAVRYWLLSQITIKSISASVSTTLSHHGDGAISTAQEEQFRMLDCDHLQFLEENLIK